MKTVALSFAVLMLVGSLFAQDHAPTAEQCRADAAVWGDPDTQTEYLKSETAHHMDDGKQNKTEIARLPYGAISARMLEMGDCEKVDPQNAHVYHEVMRFYHDVMADRWYDFIIRHHLYGQFEEEDAKGTR